MYAFQCIGSTMRQDEMNCVLDVDAKVMPNKHRVLLPLYVTSELAKVRATTVVVSRCW